MSCPFLDAVTTQDALDVFTLVVSDPEARTKYVERLAAAAELAAQHQVSGSLEAGGETKLGS